MTQIELDLKGVGLVVEVQVCLLFVDAYSSSCSVNTLRPQRKEPQGEATLRTESCSESTDRVLGPSDTCEPIDLSTFLFVVQASLSCLLFGS